ncbi:MAG TPA: alpha/beta fold hydrolase [Gemmataceae bacterium]|nr:alpha/beta fold hydrolase [Gemmataceae bacterium]
MRIWTHVAGDGYRWHYRHFLPKPRPKARVVCLHGIQSHGGWYEASCRRLRDEGCDVFFLDRRGSGLNPEARGDTPSFRRLLDDVGEFLQTLRGPGSPPLFAAAISWGGKLGAGIDYRFPALIDGLALLAPGFCPLVRLSRIQRVAIAMTALTSPNQFFPIPLDDPALFTASPQWQKFISSDPLALRTATARFLFQSARFDWFLKRAVRRVRVPVLLQLAGKDQIIHNAQTRRFLGRFGSRYVRIFEYPEAEHTLEFEPPPQTHLDDLCAWIDTTSHFLTWRR